MVNAPATVGRTKPHTGSRTPASSSTSSFTTLIISQSIHQVNRVNNANRRHKPRTKRRVDVLVLLPPITGVLEKLLAKIRSHAKLDNRNETKPT